MTRTWARDVAFLLLECSIRNACCDLASVHWSRSRFRESVYRKKMSKIRPAMFEGWWHIARVKESGSPLWVVRKKKIIPVKPNTSSVVEQNKPYTILLFRIWKLHRTDWLGRLCTYAGLYREYQWTLINRGLPKTFGVCLFCYWPLHAKLIGWRLERN